MTHISKEMYNSPLIIKKICKLDAVSFLPILIREDFHEPERTVYWARREGGAYGGQAYYAARRGVHKILQNTPYEPFQFFNLGQDPGEKNPLPHSD